MPVLAPGRDDFLPTCDCVWGRRWPIPRRNGAKRAGDASHGGRCEHQDAAPASATLAIEGTGPAGTRRCARVCAGRISRRTVRSHHQPFLPRLLQRGRDSLTRGARECRGSEDHALGGVGLCHSTATAGSARSSGDRARAVHRLWPADGIEDPQPAGPRARDARIWVGVGRPARVAGRIADERVLASRCLSIKADLDHELEREATRKGVRRHPRRYGRAFSHHRTFHDEPG